ncbi:MAG: 30S ribosomal protein S20 [Rhodospirillales bacterium]|nr:30S ribosomal protein S20 [Rhodospirillales bacterium]
MAKTESAKKKARQALKRKAINQTRTSRYRSYVKKVETAITAGNKAAAQAALKEAQPVLMSSVGLGTVLKNTVARKLSRLSARIKAL